MFDKKAFMSHVTNETANDKMLKAGINAPFYGEIQEKKYGKKITKSHGKEYPKGTHMCATHVEHAQWGRGTPLHGEHAAPDAAGNISWYNVMFEHGVERINTADVRVLAESEHENHDHHDHPGENLTENVLNDPIQTPNVERDLLGRPIIYDVKTGGRARQHGRESDKDAFRAMMNYGTMVKSFNPDVKITSVPGEKDPARSPKAKRKRHGLGPLDDAGASERGDELVYRTDESLDVVMEQIIAKVVSMLSGRGDRPEGSGQNYPGRGNQPTDHKKIKGKNRDSEDNNLC